MIAERIGYSVDKAKAETTSTQFLRWQKRFEDEVNEFHREDWFLAQLSYQLYLMPYRIWGVKPPESPTFDDFLIKFTTKKEKVPVQPQSEEGLIAARKEQAQALKESMLAIFGMWADGTSHKKAPEKVMTVLDPNAHRRKPVTPFLPPSVV